MAPPPGHGCQTVASSPLSSSPRPWLCFFTFPPKCQSQARLPGQARLAGCILTHLSPPPLRVDYSAPPHFSTQTSLHPSSHLKTNLLDFVQIFNVQCSNLPAHLRLSSQHIPPALPGSQAAKLHCTALHCSAVFFTELHCTVLYCTALHCSALHCTALHCTALHCTGMHCPSLQRTAFHTSALHCNELHHPKRCDTFSCSANELSHNLKERDFWDGKSFITDLRLNSQTGNI